MPSNGANPRQAAASAGSNWKRVVAKYQKPALGRGVWQLANTLVPYAVLWWLLDLSLRVSYWLTAGLVLLAGGFLVRVFIIFHDCGHGSFFRSQRANNVVGFITGILTFTPYFQWRWEHAIHHSAAGDLDRRGTGDVWTMTVQEYLAAGRWEKLAYRLARNPVILFFLAPVFLFLLKQRFVTKGAPPRERRSVYWTNVCLLLMGLVMSLIFGFGTFLVLQLAVVIVAGTAGVWLFYVQHQFEGVYWERTQTWDYCTAALKGSSFYRLPKILQWFSGNIGFHHIHHLSPRIPNYNLEKCHKAEPLFQTVTPVTFLGSLKSLSFRLWDEQMRRLVSFRELKRARARLSLGGRA